MATPRTVVFDLGNVLIDWDPRYLYRRLFAGDEAAMERFLAEVCTPAWNHEQDRGRAFAEGCAIATRAHPDKRELIEAWFANYDETIAGEVPGTVAVLAALRDRGVPLYALTNWSAETFPRAQARFEFLQWFRGIVVSGALGMAKPEPAIFTHLLETYGLEARETVFIDDSPANVAGAEAIGMRALRFTDAATLRDDLRALGLL